MAKKTPTPTKPAKPPANEVQLSDLIENDLVELTLSLKFRDTRHSGALAEFLDSDGDEVVFRATDIVSIRMAPKPVVQVTGPDAERAAKLLRDRGFTVD